MLAGFGRAEITPPLGLELCGYGYYLGRRAESVLDPLYVRSLCLSWEKTTVFLVCCDLLGLSRTVVDRVKQGLAEAGWAPEHLMIVSIHTHCGPAVKYHEGCGYTDPDYGNALPGHILEACLRSAENRMEVTAIGQTSGMLPEGLIYNRSSEDGDLDRQVRGVVLRRGSAKPVLLVSCGCHPVTLGVVPQVSADYPGQVCRLMEEKGFETMFLNGLCGDVDPVRTPGLNGIQRRDRLAEAVADQALLCMQDAPVKADFGRLPFKLQLMPVTRSAISESADAAVARAGGEHKPAARVARIWEKEMLERFDTLVFEEPISVPFLILGGRLILALPFEGFGRIGGIVRSWLHMPDVMVLGCGEEILGYLPTRDDIEQGNYAALESTYLYKRLPVLPGEAERLGEALAEMLEEMPGTGGENLQS